MKNEILSLYEKNVSRYEIAQYVLDAGEADNFTDALKIVEAVVLQAKNMSNRSVRV